MLLKAEHISKRFDNKIILTDVHLCVESGEIVTLIGPNGAGKSTLVRIILGLISQDSGKIILKPNIRLGYMPQKIQIDAYLPLSVLRFLQLSGEAFKDKQQFTKILEETQILDIMSHPLQEISGGEFQKVLLARALLRKPDLLVLDEPVQGVDITGQESLYHLITRIRDRFHCGILMVSHDLHLVMADTDSVVRLNKHICCSGTPEAVSRHPEFLNLFGPAISERIAVYTHKHDHHHDSSGEICN